MTENPVLIVEDAPTQAQQLKYTLEKAHFLVVWAKNGLEALSWLEKNRPLLVFSDVTMPGMTGFDLCSAIKSKEGLRHIPVVLLTSLSDMKDIIRGLECGADNFVSKPYEEKHLLAMAESFRGETNRVSQTATPIEIHLPHDEPKRSIRVDPQKMVNLLVSSYEAAVYRNHDLTQTQEALSSLNERLEELVEERTAELARGEEKYRRVVESIQDIIYSSTVPVTSESHVLSFISPQVEKVLGYPPSDFLTIPDLWQKCIHPDDREQVAKQTDRAFAEKQASTRIYRFRKKNSEKYLWLEDGFQPMFDEAEQPSGFFGMARDVSERIQSEKQKHLTREVLGLLNRQESVVDATHNILHIIRQELDVEAIGVRLSHREDFPFRDTIGLSEQYLEESQSLLVKDEQGNVRRDAQEKPLLKGICGQVLRGNPPSGKPYFTSGGSFWANRISSVKDTGPGDLLLEFAACGSRHDQYESVAYVPIRSGHDILGILHLSDHRPDRFTLETIGVLEELGTNFGIALARERDAEALRESYETLEGKVRQRTEELSIAKNRAESATKAKSNFLANMSHEIRTPMNALLGMTYLALKTDPKPQLRKYLEKITAASQLLLQIINDILDFSKIEAGRMDLELVDFSVKKITSEVLEMFQMKALEKSLNVYCHVSDALPSYVKGDALRLKQILVNLLSNALKFTERGEIHLTVVGREETENSVTLAFSVSDTGIGLSPEEQGRLFTPFSQADSSTTRKYGGTGLGLSISRRLVSLMGGDLSMESTKGKGTTFTFWVPLLRGSPPQEMLERVGFTSKNVLVVSDRYEVQTALEFLLLSWSFAVELCKSEADAWEFLRNPQAHLPWNLLVLDWGTAGLDGAAFLKRVKEIGGSEKPVSVLVLSEEDVPDVDDEVKVLHLDLLAPRTISASAIFNGILDVFSAQVAKRASSDSLKNMRILLVEDNQVNQEVAVDLLSREGVQVTLADNGQVALDILEKQTFDLILMDIQMPVMDGLEATKRIRSRENGKDIPIIAMTAEAFEEDKEAAIAAGMNGHVAKPINPDGLFAAIKIWSRTSRPAGDASLAPQSVTNIVPVAGWPELPEVNIPEVFNRFRGNWTLFIRLLEKFVSETPHTLNFLAAAIDTRDVSQARFLAHSLKGTSGNLGLKRIHELLAGLEPNIGQDPSSALGETIEQLRQIVRVIQAGIEDHRGEFPEQVPFSGSDERPDLGALLTGLEGIERLLHEGDFRSQECLAALKTDLEKVLGPQSLVPLMTKALEEYDFELALDHLGRLTTKLKELTSLQAVAPDGASAKQRT